MNDIAVGVEETGDSRSLDLNSRRSCWVCFACDEDEPSATWINPCKCRGSSKWVHQMCLQRWIDEKQHRQGTVAVACPQCNTEYVIVYPQLGPLVYLLDTIDNVVYKVCPLIAAGIFVGSIYWTAVSYGAVTVMQVIGPRDALVTMEAADPLVLLIGLPTIPFMLVAGKLIKWEDAVLMFLRKYSPKLPLSRYVLPFFMTSGEPESLINENIPPLTNSVSSTSVLCSALLLPTIATFCGKIFYNSVSNNLHRALLGGITFITVKGVLKIYHKQQQFVRKSQRKILDYESISCENMANDVENASGRSNTSQNIRLS